MLKELIKEILREEIGSNAVSENKAINQHSITSSVIGKYVIVRSRNEGINAGYVVQADETGVVLKEARRLWYHRPVKKVVCWYEGVAKYGISADSKLSCKVSLKIIVEDYSMVLCSDEAKETIEKAESNEQS